MRLLAESPQGREGGECFMGEAFPNIRFPSVQMPKFLVISNLKSSDRRLI